ncbi:MAG: thiamine pyrophosphate-dependent enzyme [Candidatus Falkowbacteria bacterium]
MQKSLNKQQFLSPGHNACAGCGELIALHAVMRGLDENTILTNATGCSEVTTSAYPTSSWGLPWIHSLFENAAAVASGVRAGLEQQGKKNIKVVTIGGDGATFDIGLGLISGAWERGDDFLYICVDTEAYSNTGIQSSGATPYGASTTTAPNSECVGENCPNVPGSTEVKKDMIAIALAHGLNYVAQSTAGFPDDITAKVKKALSIKGPSYIQILSPCIPGWKINTDMSVKLGKLAAQTGLYPLLEYENGVLSRKMNLPTPTPSVDEYLKLQGRFGHLFKNEVFKKDLAHIQDLANKNITRYGLQTSQK